MKLLKNQFTRTTKLLNQARTAASAVKDKETQVALKSVIDAGRALVRETEGLLQAIVEELPDRSRS